MDYKISDDLSVIKMGGGCILLVSQMDGSLRIESEEILELIAYLKSFQQSVQPTVLESGGVEVETNFRTQPKSTERRKVILVKQLRN